MSVMYAIHGDIVVSQRDGDIHFVSAPMLARLYGLQPGQWIDATRAQSMFGLKNPEDLIHLYPRSDGDYSLDEGTQ